MRTRPLFLAIFLALLLGRAESAEVILKTRETLVGTITETRLDYIRLRTASGEMRIERKAIESIISTATLKKRFAEKRARLGKAPSAPDLDALAQWCSEKELADERKTVQAEMKKLYPEGKKVEAGKPTEKEADELSSSQPGAIAEKQWYGHLRRAATRYQRADSADAKRDIAAEIEKVRSPAAHKPFVQMLSNRSDEVRALFVEIVASRRIPGSGRKLAQLAVEDNVPDIRLTALKALPHVGDAAATRYLIGRLSPRPDKLETTSRSARALAEIGDPRAVDKLVDVLVTAAPPRGATMRRTVSATGIRRIRPAVAPGVVVPDYEIEPIRRSTGIGGNATPPLYGNAMVLDALAQITGQDFKYDQATWRAWWRQNKKVLVDRYEKVQRTQAESPQR